MTIFLSHHVAKLVRHFMLMATIVLFCSSNNAWGQSTEIQELKLENEALKKQVRALESANPVKTPEDPKVKTKKVAGNPWHSLQVNLSKAEVISLLGKPGKVDKWKTGEAWYFPNPRGGEVDFNASEIVTGWLEP